MGRRSKSPRKGEPDTFRCQDPNELKLQRALTIRHQLDRLGNEGHGGPPQGGVQASTSGAQALDEPDLSLRELAVNFTDTKGSFVSEASVITDRGTPSAHRTAPSDRTDPDKPAAARGRA
jgi:hypothetical protein